MSRITKAHVFLGLTSVLAGGFTEMLKKHEWASWLVIPWRDRFLPLNSKFNLFLQTKKKIVLNRRSESRRGCNILKASCCMTVLGVEESVTTFGLTSVTTSRKQQFALPASAARDWHYSWIGQRGVPAPNHHCDLQFRSNALIRARKPRASDIQISIFEMNSPQGITHSETFGRTSRMVAIISQAIFLLPLKTTVNALSPR